MFDVASVIPPNAVLAVGIFAGAFVAGFAGFGLAAAAGAFLLHVIDPRTAVPLMMLCSVAAQAMGLIHLRKTLIFKPAAPFICGGLAGLPVALVLFQSTDSDTFRTAFGLFLVLYSIWAISRQLSRRHPALFPSQTSAVMGSSAPPRSSLADAFPRPVVGFFAGIVGGMTAMPGALVSVWADSKGLGKNEQRSLVQPFILVMQLSALAMMLVTPDLLSPELLELSLLSVVPLGLGTAFGLYCFGRVDAEVFRFVVLAIVLASGAGLVTG